ncbi:MAG: hypothetical protein WAO08_13710 [Hyphomicrobiaceae bacterium]
MASLRADVEPTPPTPAQERQYRNLQRYWGELPTKEEFEQRKDEQAKKGKPKKGPTVKSPAKTAGKVPKQGKTDAT